MTAALHWPLLLLLAAQLFQAAPAPQIWQCAPCSADNLSLCPPVPTSCSEVTRPAGCGCCPVCALQLEEACGVTTARCARGLRCRARPGESRPLYALTQGRGICMRELDETSTEATEPSSLEDVTTGSSEVTQEDIHLMTPSREVTSILWNAVSNYDRIKGLQIDSIDSKKEPCKRELHEVLDRLAKEQQKPGAQLYKFYLPNCKKNGLYNSKQCETTLDGVAGLCWCVYPWNGEKIPTSLTRKGDPNCQQYFESQS
ncbi:insulin-like growth factor-binding protein 1 [Erinaceus europaeus]|uniref:Insulin-like growth factor-binding protein 1 n=1 Tax=Erinaceus europaeus TaxID=9365 RepID=A0A1S3AKD0_ERIEU|nr:insulin-like growth factor-binding protein 1 [Erinaceus europaeus]